MRKKFGDVETVPFLDILIYIIRYIFYKSIYREKGEELCSKFFSHNKIIYKEFIKTNLGANFNPFTFDIFSIYFHYINISSEGTGVTPQNFFLIIISYIKSSQK